MKAPLVVRVNGMVVRRVKVREFVWDGHPTGEQELIIFDPVVGSFSVDDSFTFEVKYLTVPEPERPSLPNEGWQPVTLRELLHLLTSAHDEQPASPPEQDPPANPSLLPPDDPGTSD